MLSFCWCKDSIKSKTPVISRSFNHQSKNEQLLKLLLFSIFLGLDVKF
ncbi:hypothetical protein FEDK69T_14820 [Flavobacterium enshiense DK69]|nr:hypothetical protein FEDK69T_14820 [Flavobacterium enshiense DK69]